MNSKLALLLAASMVLVLQACSTGSSTDEATPLLTRPAAEEVESPIQGSGAAGGLPSPADLMDALPDVPREASFEQEDLLRAAEDFNPELPFNRVSPETGGLALSPDWFPGDSLEGLSYAMYSFQLPNFEGQAVLSYNWVVAPTNPERVFVALANWDLKRWSWHSGNAEGRIDLASFDPHFIAGGNMLVCFLITGESPAVLDTIRIGSLPPQVSLSSDLAAGLAPCSFLLTASALDPDGTVEEYLWDPEGDGSFDVSSGSEPTLVAEYTTADRHRPAVRAVDNDGIFGEAELELAVYSQSPMNFGLPAQFDGGRKIIISSDGQLLVFGEVGDTDMLFSSLGPTGELSFAKLAEAGVTLSSRSALLASDGFIYLCGTSYEGSILQKWTQNGDIVWSKRLATNEVSDAFNELSELPNGNLVCVGTRLSGSELLGTIMCFSKAGLEIWDKEISLASGHVNISDMELFQGGEGAEIRICGTVSADETDPLYASFDSAGNLLECSICETDSIDERPKAITSLPGGEVLMAGDLPFFGIAIGFVVSVGVAGHNLLKDVDDQVSFSCLDLRPCQDGRLQLFLSRSNNSSVVCYLDSAGTVQSSELYAFSEDSGLRSLQGLGADGYVMTGYTDSDSPDSAPAFLEADVSDQGGWITFEPTIFDGPLTLEDLPLTVADVSAQIVFGNDAGGNHCVILQKLSAP